MTRRSYLTPYDFANLNDALISVEEAFPEGLGTFLVGSATTKPDYRDVDIRLVLKDEDFDHLFAGRKLMWSVICRGIAAWLRDVTRLPVDFQIQRMTEANEKYPGVRNPMGKRSRPYAGAGDATAFDGPPGTRTLRRAVCRTCGCSSDVTHGKQRYCSVSCSQKMRYQRMKNKRTQEAT
jgi:hypothetical protein